MAKNSGKEYFVVSSTEQSIILEQVYSATPTGGVEHPMVTTFNTPAEELSRAAIDFIDTYIKTGTRLKLPVIQGDLIIRDSVRKAGRKPAGTDYDSQDAPGRV